MPDKTSCACVSVKIVPADTKQAVPAAQGIGSQSQSSRTYWCRWSCLRQDRPSQYKTSCACRLCLQHRVLGAGPKVPERIAVVGSISVKIVPASIKQAVPDKNKPCLSVFVDVYFFQHRVLGASPKVPERLGVGGAVSVKIVPADTKQAVPAAQGIGNRSQSSRMSRCRWRRLRQDRPSLPKYYLLVCLQVSQHKTGCACACPHGGLYKNRLCLRRPLACYVIGRAAVGIEVYVQHRIFGSSPKVPERIAVGRAVSVKIVSQHKNKLCLQAVPDKTSRACRLCLIKQAVLAGCACAYPPVGVSRRLRCRHRH